MAHEPPLGDQGRTYFHSPISGGPRRLGHLSGLPT